MELSFGTSESQIVCKSLVGQAQTLGEFNWEWMSALIFSNVLDIFIYF